MPDPDPPRPRSAIFDDDVDDAPFIPSPIDGDTSLFGGVEVDDLPLDPAEPDDGATIIPFSPRDEARTCVPHGRRDCAECTAALDEAALATVAGADAVRQARDDSAPPQDSEDPPAAPTPPTAPLGQGAAQAPPVGSSTPADAGPPPSRDLALEAALRPQLGLDLGLPHDVTPGVSLRDRFVVPPFSTLDARATEWKERKRAWLDLGIDGELGRDGGLAYENTATVLDPDFYRKKEEVEAREGRRFGVHEFILSGLYVAPDSGRASVTNSGTSVFDPVLCEVAYRWFSPPDGVVLDPFAGGSVRGIVAAILGRRYYGVELREEQIRANRVNAAKVIGEESPYAFDPAPVPPTWCDGDATTLRALGPFLAGLRDGEAPKPWADLVFTCPPYADLEVYSDDARDLSTAGYPLFRAMLASAVAQAAEALKPDRFFVIVLGEARHPRTGAAYGIIADAVIAARQAGLDLYNEAILTTAVASAAVRAQRQVVTSRKLVRVHQHVLVFVKGDGRRAADACGDPLRGAS